MNILEKFSSLVSSNNNINKDSVKKILDKYKYSVPLSLDDITKMDSEDIKELLKIYDSKNCDSLYEALSLNMTVLKMYKSNPNNLFFKEKHDQAIIYINNLIINLNSFYSRYITEVSNDLLEKYSTIITKDGIKDTIANFDELDNVLDSLNLSLFEKGKIKQEVGKSNIRFADLYKDVNINNEELFNKVNEIIKNESELINSVSKDNLSSFIDGDGENCDDNLRIVSLLIGMYSEMNKALKNKDKIVLYNSSIKLINEYIKGYSKLKGE